jgi:hypothetical protein
VNGDAEKTDGEKKDPALTDITNAVEKTTVEDKTE